MLQNPSKYHHPNPLSHFLALHSSQAAAHNVHTHTLPAAAIAAHSNQLHQHQQQQQHPLAGSHSHHPLRSPHIHTQPHSHPHAHLIDATNTSLDVGKSFTIAAILGLQKSAMESSRKEYSNVINLSLNGGSGCSSAGSSSNRSLHSLTPPAAANEMDKVESRLMPNNNNSGNSKISACNSFAAGVNNLNCDSNAAAMSGALVNRYLPSANVANAVSSAATFVVNAAHQQQQHMVASHARANGFAAATAVAAAAAANVSANGGTPSALQSLQQLHQHHAQQTNLSFQREKIKADGTNAKKSSLKNKRVRTIFTPEQLERLEAEFERQQYMVGPERLYLAHTLQLTEAQVKVWFQNRRIKWRKHHLEITQQRLALLRQNQLPTGANNTSASAVAALASSAICEEVEDMKNCEDLQQLDSSRQASDSDLSICNDSMDADSVIDGGEGT